MLKSQQNSQFRTIAVTAKYYIGQCDKYNGLIKTKMAAADIFDKEKVL